MSFPPPFDLAAYEPPTSLWELVQTTVPETEQDEIKNVLGASVVEQSKELHEEISMLLDIWRDYRDETDDMHVSSLPEPPAARDRLVQEIRFFVDSIKERAKEQGRLDQVLKKHNGDVLEYAFDRKSPGSSGYGSRPSTARSSRDGRETPARRGGTPSTGRRSQISELSDEVSAITEKFDFMKLDEVSQHLRQTLEDEVQQLVSDIAFLQGCLEEEADYRSESRQSSEPSLVDLREERALLEKELLTDTSASPALQDIPSRAPRTPPIKTPPALKDLKTGAPSLHRSGSGLQKISQRPAPLKASHSIAVESQTTGDINSNLSSDDKSHKKRQSVKKSANVEAPISHVTIRVGSAEAPRPPKEATRGRSSPSSVKVKRGDDKDRLQQQQQQQPNQQQKQQQQRQGDKVPAAVKVPSPPSSAKPKTSRPSSAASFRNMVLTHRDES